MQTLLSKIREALAPDHPRLWLYSSEYCYYCRLVLREASRLGIELEVVDVFSNRKGRERLRAGTGRTRVPVLGLMDSDGKERFLAESEVIIRHLRELNAEPPANFPRVPLAHEREHESEHDAAE